MDNPSTIAGVRALLEQKAQQARTDNDAYYATYHADSTPASPAYREGHVKGWRTAVSGCAEVQRLSPEGLHLTGAGEVASLHRLQELLAENRRRAGALTLANVNEHTRQGTMDALAEAVGIVDGARLRAARTLGEATAVTPEAEAEDGPSSCHDPDDLGDWTGYPKVAPQDGTLSDLSDLALFMGGDRTSFGGDLLRLIAKADPENLNRLGLAYPRHVRAFLVWRACAPVPARTLVGILEASAMMPPRRTP